MLMETVEGPSVWNGMEGCMADCLRVIVIQLYW